MTDVFGQDRSKMHSFNSQKTGPKVLPIFKMRKRPRQALYAVPSSQGSNNKGPADTPNINAPQPQTSSTLQYGVQNITPTTNKFNNAPSTAQFKGAGKWEMPSNLYGASSSSFQQPAAAPQSRYQAPGNKPSHIQSRKIQPANLLPRQGQSNFSPRNQGPYNQNQLKPQNTHRPAPNPKSFQPQQRPNQPIQQRPHQPIQQMPNQLQQRQNQLQQRPNQAFQRYASPSHSGRPSTSGSAPFQPTAQNFARKSEYKQQPPSPSPVTPVKTLDKKPAHKATPEERMRILTLSVEGVKKWSQILADDGMLMFEVFGLLNSDVVFIKPKCAKEFMLKDGSHTLQCIFYETGVLVDATTPSASVIQKLNEVQHLLEDGPMPHVTRGQWVRCVGIFRNSITTLQCVSIRPATPAEQRWMKQQMGACEKALKSQLAAVKMEP